MPAFKPFQDFSSAATEALRFLHDRFGFGLWMITRTEGEDWIVLCSEDHSYGVKAGAVFRWTDSFCSRMVQGLGPCVAPDSMLIPAYKDAPIGQQVPIGAYIGIPLKDGDGELFGTLCAIDPQPQDPTLENELPLIQLIGRLLSTCIVYELKTNADQRRQLQSELSLSSKTADSETGFLSMDAMSKLIAAEEIRCRKLGTPASILRIRTSPNPLGATAAIATAAKELLGSNYAIGRVGNVEFLVLIPECDASNGNIKKNAMVSRLNELGIEVTVNSAVRDPRSTLEAALKASEFVSL